MEMLFQHLRYGLRTLVRTPGFSLIVILVMALGIGATLAMFTVVHSVLMKPLPFHEQEGLVRIYEADSHDPTHNHIAVSGLDFLDWRQQQKQSFEQMAIADNWNSYNLSGTGGQLPEHVIALTASWNMFQLLGVEPAFGRFFDADDDRPQADAAVVLSWGLWKRRYGGDTKILGQTIRLDAKAYTVIGVLPVGYDFPDPTVQLWTPLFHETQPQWIQSHGAHNFQIFARLKPGVTVAQAQAETSAIQAGIHQRFPDNSFIFSATRVVPLLESRVGNIQPALLMLLAATGCLLLIGCLNVANLLVARSAARRREAAIRTALGGGRWRLVQEQLVESVLLCAAGGTLGLLLASMAIHWLVSVCPRHPARRGHSSGQCCCVGWGWNHAFLRTARRVDSGSGSQGKTAPRPVAGLDTLATQWTCQRSGKTHVTCARSGADGGSAGGRKPAAEESPVFLVGQSRLSYTSCTDDGRQFARCHLHDTDCADKFL